MRKTIKALLRSSVICLFCVSMLTSSSYAWYTTYQEEGTVVQKETTGKAAELSWTDTYGGEWHVAGNSGVTTETNNEAIFTYDYWEPGYAQVRYVRLSNVGNDLLQYYMRVNDVTESSVSIDLAQVIDVYFIENPTHAITAADLTEDNYEGTLAQVILASSDSDGVAHGSLTKGKYVIAGIVLKMKDDAGNEYQEAVKRFNLQIKLSPFIISNVTQ